MTELARPLLAERIGAGGLAIVVTADPAECAAVARRLILPAVAGLECRWSLRTGPAGSVEAQGELRAAVTQLCILSLDPFEAKIAEDFTIRFVLEDRVSEEADDPAEPDELVYDGTTLDLGEATVEQLALALDPYPRKPGATLDSQAGEASPNPFAVLAQRRNPN